MPLFMDYHQFESISVTDVKKAHIADMAMHEKYGIKYQQLWINEEAGSVFCLIEAPDKQSCEDCHREAHGIIACNIQEVEPGFFKLFMGEGLPIEEDMTLTQDRTLDPGDRTIMVADIHGLTHVKNARNYKELLATIKPKNLVVETIGKFEGRFIQHAPDDTLVGVFDSSVNGIRCARKIQKDLSKLAEEHGEQSEWNVIFKMGLHKGQPLTENEGFFEAAMEQAKRLCSIAEANQISLSSNLKNLYEMESKPRTSGTLHNGSKALNMEEENFINRLFEVTEQNLHLSTFNVNNLSELIGMSRPQVYRKVSSLTGMAPNGFIKYVRMNKALSLLKNKKGNVSEIAAELGFTNPSYFSKVFNDYFGYPPSQYTIATRSY